MGKIIISGMKAATIMRLKRQGYNIKDIAFDVELSPKFVSRLLKNESFFSCYGVTTLLRNEPQNHPRQHPCMLEKKLWPKCSHGQHCYLSGHCEAWTNYKNGRVII